MKTTTVLLLLASLVISSCGASSDLVSRDAPEIEPLHDAGPSADARPPDVAPDTGACDADCGTSRVCEPGADRCETEARLRVATRDGVLLDTLVLVPSDAGAGPFPTLLLRTPYGLANGETFRPFVTREGYALVVQSCRGTAESGGTLDPLGQEFDDGQDAVRWIASQPWSNGRIATIGASYEGFTALAAAVDNPEVVLAIADGNISHAFTGWPGQRGIPMAAGLLWWLEIVETGRDLMAEDAFWSAVTNDRPLLDVDEWFLGREHPVWRRFAAEADRDSAFWGDRSLDGKMNRVCAPALIFQAATEWADDPRDAFVEAITTPCDDAVGQAHRFVLGPGGHASAVYDPFSESLSGRLIRDALDAVLRRDDREALSDLAVASYWVAGAEEWRTAGAWPPPHENLGLYLEASTGALAPEAAGGADTVSLAFDPEAMDACDYAGTTAPPGATFTSEPLDEPIDVVGAPALEITVSTDLEDADVIAWLYEVTDGGQMPWAVSQRLRLRFRDGYREPRAMPRQSPVPVTVAFGTMARRIAAGSRIALWVSTSECGVPENAGAVLPVMTTEEMRSGVLTVWSGSQFPSRLVLPIDR